QRVCREGRVAVARQLADRERGADAGGGDEHDRVRLAAALAAPATVGDDRNLRSGRDRHTTGGRAQVTREPLFGQVVGGVVVHDVAPIMSSSAGEDERVARRGCWWRGAAGSWRYRAGCRAP